jgi:hypothetical protein
MAEQLIAAFAENAPGSFAFTIYPTEAEALAAIDQRDTVAALVAGPTGPRLVVAGAAGDAVTGGITAALTNAFQAQGAELPVEVVHPFGSGDPHGIVLFFLVLATVITSVVVGALTVLGTPGRPWMSSLGVIATYAVLAGVVGTFTAAWLVGGYDDVWLVVGLVALVSFAVAIVIAACARILGPVGVALGALIVVLVGLVSSGGPLGSAFLPDAYRAVAPWLPVDAAYSAIRGALYFDGAGVGTPVIILALWAIGGIVVLAAPDFVGQTRPRTAATAAA